MDLFKFPLRNLDRMVIGAAYFFSGLITLLTLGFVLPSFHMDYVEWRTRLRMRKVKGR